MPAYLQEWTADDVARGVMRLLVRMGYAPLREVTIGNGRRFDVLGLDAKGLLYGVEIKVAIADLKGDAKWPEYLDYCDGFAFAVPPNFPNDLVPASTGLIIADARGGEIVRPAPAASVVAARRKATTLRFAQIAALRFAHALDPELSAGGFEI